MSKNGTQLHPKVPSGEEAVSKSPVARRHRGDIMSPEKRSAVMSRIRGRDTGPERAVADLLTAAGIGFEAQGRDLPGRPDFVFRAERVVVLVDGDFWHGWRYPLWRDKLSPAWEAKIEANRQRDLRNMRRLRHQGWRVVRLWEHQIKASPQRCMARIRAAIESSMRQAAADETDRKT